MLSGDQRRKCTEDTIHKPAYALILVRATTDTIAPFMDSTFIACVYFHIFCEAIAIFNGTLPFDITNIL